MTAKEKAKELVEFFMHLNSVKLSDYSRIEWPTAKQCALKVVDEVIKQNNVWIRLVNKGTNNYWQEVKQEIENL
jgi:preprotein translocase subunit SecE